MHRLSLRGAGRLAPAGGPPLPRPRLVADVQATFRTTASRLLDLFFPPRCPGCVRRCDTADFCPDCERRITSIAPPFCICCGEPFTSGPDHLCARCIRDPPHFARARAVALYRSDSFDPLAVAIARYKYGFDASLAPILSRLLWRNFPFDSALETVIPVPLHIDRLRWRGFNQASLLAQGLARRCDLAFAPAALQRRSATPPQVGLGESERRRNIRGAFHVRQPGAVAGRAILLVDDVYTTGATANECARTLRRAGARSVDVFVLARAV